MRRILLTLLLTLLVLSCSRYGTHEPINPIAEATENASFLSSHYSNETIYHRCDRLTFHALFSAFSGQRQDVTGFFHS